MTVNGLTTLAYDNQPYNGGKILQPDNSVIDTEDFLSSGEIIVKAIATPAVVPTTPAGVRKYSNFPANALKIINQDNEVFDLVQFLMSGELKVQVTSPAGDLTQGYVVFDVDSDGLVCRSLTAGNNITVENGDGSVGDAVIGLTDDVTIVGTLYTANINNPSDSDLVISAQPTYPIRLESDTVYVDQDIQHNSELSVNKISFTALSQQYYVGDDLQLDITNNGVKVGTIGARVTTIDNTGTNFATTVLMSGHAIQVAIANAMATGNSFRGGWDASSNLYPTTGGSGVGGSILAGNYWVITVAGTLSGTDVNPGDIITALVDTPLQVDSNWLIQQQKVDSVFGRIGAIIAQAGDYSFSQISGTCIGTQGGTGQTTTTANDLLIGGAGNTWNKLSKTNSAVLKTNAAGTVAWTSSLTDGQILIGATGGDVTPANVSAGAGISITNGANSIQVTNTDKGSSVTLSNAGVAVGTTSLVNDGVGADLAIKGVVGGANIAVTTNTTDTTVAFTGTLPVENGGTGNTTVGANGTLAQSDGSKYTFTTATYPTTTTINRILYSSANNVVGQITSANSAMLFTDNTGAPAFTSSLTNGQILIGNTGNSPSVSTLTAGSGITITNAAGSITIAAPNSGVSSVFGRTGAVVSATNDYNFNQLAGICAGSQGGTGQTTTTANDLLIGGASNTWTKLNKTNSAILKTDGSGNVAWTAAMTNGQILIGSTSSSPTPATLTAGSGMTITNGAGSVTVTRTGQQFATAYLNSGDNTGVNISLTTSYTEIRALSTAWTLESVANNFNMLSDGRMIYMGSTTCNVKITAYITMDNSTAGNYGLAVAKNGTNITESISYSKQSPVCTIIGLRSTGVVNGDIFSLYLRRGSSATVAILQATLAIEDYI